MVQRERGRPRSAPDLLRANGYKDAQGRYQVTELQPWHERIIDFMVGHPHAKIVDIARAFDRSPQWIGQLLKTDAFREKYSERMKEHQGLVGEEIVSKMQSVAVKALGKLDRELDTTMKFEQVQSVAQMTLQGLGFMANGAGMQVHIDNRKQTVLVDKGIVDRAREKLQKKMQDNTKVIEHDATQYQRVTSSMDVGYEGVQVDDDGDDGSGGEA